MSQTAFVGGQLITGRHKDAIQNSLVMIDRGKILYAGERNADMEPLLKEFDVMDITGSVTRGKNADMIILDGDPLKSIYDIDVDKMDMVIKDGEEVLRYKDKK